MILNRLLIAAKSLIILAAYPGQAKDTEKLLPAPYFKAWSNVTHFCIEYEAVPRSRHSESVSVRKVLAVGPSKLYHGAFHIAPGLPWQMDPFAQEFYVADGRFCHRWPFNRICSEGTIRLGDVLPGSTSQDVLLTVLPRWPLSEYKLPSTMDGITILPQHALSSENYSLSGIDFVGSERCTVARHNTGSDTLWLAQEKGFSVIKREFRNPTTGDLIQRVVAERIERITNELWFPTSVKSQFFSSKAGITDHPEEEFEITVLKLLLNDAVITNTFNSSLHPPGSLRQAGNQETEQLVRGGSDLLDQISEFLVMYANLPKSRTRAVTLGGFVIGCGIGVCLALVLCASSRSTDDAIAKGDSFVRKKRIL
jgi:hypothetical protein